MGKIISMDETRTMIAAVEEIPPVPSFLKKTFFGNIRTFVTENVDCDYRKGNSVMAPFVAPLVGGIPMERQGFDTKSFTTPRISPERVISTEHLAKRGIGEPVYSPKSPADRAAAIQAQDYIDLDDAITRREEWMCREALFNGKITIKGLAQNGDSVSMSVDYKFTNKATLTGANKWSDPASDPILQMVQWRKDIVSNCGIDPNVLLMDSETALMLTNNIKLKERFDMRNFNFGSIEPYISEPLLTYYGRLPIIGADIYSYDASYYDPETDAAVPFIPPKTVLFASTTTMNAMYYGAITIMDGAGGYHTVESPRVPVVLFDQDSGTRVLRVQSRPLPMPFNIEGWAVRVVA